ncbi:MAG: hypothetical protein JO032_03460 [Alphaproteobacteria bacterium]|nr:hypothetical protein [Alphaproteobacteria bacterium]MBV9551832.1 hypothetical protein [Alphaproteobacteria bacterium]
MARWPHIVMLVCIAGWGASGCALPALVGGSSVEGATPAGGTITRVTEFTEDGAIALAADHCARFGRAAQATGLQLATNRMTFSCVPP